MSTQNPDPKPNLKPILTSISKLLSASNSPMKCEDQTKLYIQRKNAQNDQNNNKKKPLTDTFYCFVKWK